MYTNTGNSSGPQLDALDSRFDVRGPPANCDPQTSPADTNVKEYAWNANPSDTGSPKVWMNPDPVQQSLTFQSTGVPKPVGSRMFSDYGVLWAASRPAGEVVGNWSALYGAGGSATSYPETSPYSQTSAPFFAIPPINPPGKSGRRMMRLLFVDCPTAGGTCRPATVLGIGKFFLQKKANTPSDKEIYIEYAGPEPKPLLNAELRLYR